MRHCLWPRPFVEMVQPEQEREKQQRHQGQSVHAAFEEAADRHAPAAARKVMQHHDAQASEGNAEPKHISKKIGLEKLLAAEDRADDTECQGRETDDQGAALKALPFAEHTSRFHQRCSPESFSRACGGRSFTLAFWLSCSARM